MKQALEKKLRHVRILCNLNLLLRLTGWVLACAGAAVLLAVLVERLLAVEALEPTYGWLLLAAAAVALLGAWAVMQPSRMQIAVLADERLALKERFSTTLSFANSDDPFARAACEESRHKIDAVRVKDRFPVRPTPCWYTAASTWVLALALFAFLPQKDLLGFLAKKEQKQQLAQEAVVAQQEIRQATGPVRLAVKQLGDEELAKQLDEMAQPAPDATPLQIKQDAIRQLGNLAEQLQQKQNTVDMQAVKAMENMLRQLRATSSAVSQELTQALARGDLSRAKQLMEQLQQKLESGNMTPEQREALSKQLTELAKQLSQIAQQKKELEEALEKAGLDKKLANMNPQQLKEALQKAGLTPEQMEQLLQKAAACRSAAGRCSGLAQAMGAVGAGSLSAAELGEMIDQLSQMESLQQQMMQLQATLSQCQGALAGLGQGMCQGQGQKPWAPGQSNRRGQGTGGPGQGYGMRDSDTEGQTNTTATRVKNDSEKGPIVASWTFRDTQVKGEAQRDFQEVVQAAKDNAAEAISENEIPRKYEAAVQNYFGELDNLKPVKENGQEP